jgi:hypothetical protein
LWTTWLHYVSRRAVRFMGGNLFMICQQWAVVASSISSLFSVTVYTLEQRVFLYDIQVKYRSARECRRKFRNERVPSRQTIQNLVNELRTTGLLIDKKQKHKRQVFTEQKFDDIGAIFEHTLTKSPKRRTQETGVPKSSTITVTQLLKLWPYKTTVIHALQPRDPVSRVHSAVGFYNLSSKVR